MGASSRRSVIRSASGGDKPHRRFNPLSGEWVLVSPQRTLRPWLGELEPPPQSSTVAHDPSCYLCPANQRMNSERNPDYRGTFVFDNDFPALVQAMDEENQSPEEPSDSIFRSEPVSGRCRVVCYSHRHDRTMARLSVEEIRSVVNVWAEESSQLGRSHSWVQVFENRGEAMGASNPHPHGQIWATSSVPSLVAREAVQQAAHLNRTGRNLLVQYRDHEMELGVRVVTSNESWMVCVPYWATWPFEVLVLPLSAARRMDDLDQAQQDGLAAIMKDLLVRYDNLFETSFPYSMGWHGAPYPASGNQNVSAWLLHGHFFPPLLRSASVRKFMVGYELLAEAQRDLTPEDAADRLRAVPGPHYLDR